MLYNLCLVNRTFYRQFTPLLYHLITIVDQQQLEIFLGNPKVGCVRELYVQCTMEEYSEMTAPEALAREFGNAKFRQLLAKMPMLDRFE